MKDYLWVITWMLAGLLLMRFFAHKLSDLLFKLVTKKAESLSKESLHNLLGGPLRWLIMLLVAFICTDHLEFPASWDLAPKSEFGLRLVLHRTYLAFISVVITWIALRFVSFIGLLLYARAELTENKSDDQLVPFVTEILKIIVIIFGIFFLMGAVFKIDIAALVAGLGIGGLALALAAKESLENLLASFTIFFDKPFMIGDLITVNGYTGTVEKIGFRSTRIRTLEKSYLTIPNLQMVNDVLDNLTLRTFRRVSFNIGLTYESSETQIKSIVLEIQTFIDQHPNTNQEGEIHFMDFSSSSLDIMVLYFIDTMDYRQYLIIKEQINYEIMRIVKANNASFAFPTQTIQFTKT